MQSAQRTVGFYPEVVDTESSKSRYILNSFPGLKSFASAQGGRNRGMFEHKGVVYKVTGTTLSTIDKDGNYAAIGTITGSGRCVFEGIGDNLVIVSEGTVWVFNKTSTTLTELSYTNKFLDVSTESLAPKGVFVSSDGVNIYVSSTTVVYQYTLSTPWDASTATYDSKSYSFSSEGTATGITFGENGRYFYFFGPAADTIYQYELATPWDVSTASYTSKTFDFTTQESILYHVIFGDGGRKMYAVGFNTLTIYQYNLSIPWDVSSAVYSTNSLVVSSENTDPLGGLSVNEDGSRMYLGGGTGNDTIYQYNLTAWDLSTASYASVSLDISTEEADMNSFFIKGDGTRLYVLGQTSDRVHQYSTSNEVTDTDLETPNAVAHLNNQAIYDGDGGRFVTSDVGDATSINGLNYGTAESSPDNIIRPYVFNQTLYLFGEKTVETWYNSGVGNPPFDRIDGGIMPVGLGALHSTAHNDNFLYFLGDDNKVYRIVGSGKENISTIALSHELSGYVVSDAIGATFSFDNQNFYLLSFPKENRSWCYSEDSGQWFEPNESRYLGDSFVFAFRKNLVADHRNGNVYELDMDTFDENGSLVERFRDTGPIHGELLGGPGKRVEMNRFELIMETGVGRLPNTSDNRENPYIMLSFSDDGGDTFSTEMWGTVGKMSKYTKVQWHGLGSFYERIIRVKVSDPNFWSIHSANADMEVGI